MSAKPFILGSIRGLPTTIMRWISPRGHEAELSGGSLPVTLSRGDSVGRFSETPRAFNAPPNHKYVHAAYVDFPLIVCIETAASCNADCSFCTYGVIARKHTRLSDEKIFSILDELKAVPHAFNLQFAGISEPLVDKRAETIFRHAATTLPNATISLYTNGALLNDKNRRWICDIPVRHVSVSLNETDPQRYYEVMKLDLEKTLSCLDALHDDFPRDKMRVDLTRVGDKGVDDQNFFDFAARRFPKFNAVCNTPFVWLSSDKNAEEEAQDFRELPCKQWFAARVLADGKVTLCNQDDEARYSHGSIHDTPLLQIYHTNRFRHAREVKAPRGDLPLPCSECRCTRQGSLPF